MKNYRPKRSAFRSPSKPTPGPISSPSAYDHFTQATVAFRWPSKEPARSRKSACVKAFQRLAQTAITWASKVKTSMSSPRGCGISMSHGGTFADRPKSTILISPAFAVDICSFKFAPVADHHRGGCTVEIRLAPRGLFALEIADCRTLPAGQRGQFGKGFNRTHRQKLTLQRGAGKRGFVARGNSAKDSWRTGVHGNRRGEIPTSSLGRLPSRFR